MVHSSASNLLVCLSVELSCNISVFEGPSVELHTLLNVFVIISIIDILLLLLLLLLLFYLYYYVIVFYNY